MGVTSSIQLCHILSLYAKYPTWPSLTAAAVSMAQGSQIIGLLFFWFNITPGQKLGVFSITSSSTDFKTCGWYTFLVSNPAESFLFPHFLNQPLVILLGILWGALDSYLCSSWHWTRSFTSPPIETIKDRAFCCSFLFSLYTLFF